MFFSRLLAPLHSLPNIRWMPLLAFVYFAVSFLLNPNDALHTHQMIDPDDYMRLNETINWLQSAHPFGKGWYDLSFPRLAPGDHTIVHWARLVDLPIALFALPLIGSFGMQGAVMTASFIVPPLLFVILLLTVPLLARPLIEKRRSHLAAIFALFASTVSFNFLPGRVDHHGYQIVIGAIALTCLQRIVLCPRGWKAAIAAAIVFACGLWIGTEALPWLILFTGCLAIIAGWRGGFVLRNAAVFGIALPIAVAAAIVLALPPSQYTSRALSWFSAGDLIYALLAGAIFIFGWIGARFTDNRCLRLALIAALGFLTAALFFYLVPDALNGPFADYDDFNATTALENIGEAQPFWISMHFHFYAPGTIWHALMLFLRIMFMPFLASAVVIRNLIRERGHTRLVWFMHGFFLIPAVLLTLLWQVRVGWFAQIFCIAPLTWLAWHCWDKIAARGMTGRPRFWAEITAFLLIAPLPVVLLPAIIGQAHIYPEVLLFPSVRPVPTCPLLHASEFLNEAYGDHPRMIISGMNEGPELMFRTPHNVLAAPFNVNGNTDGFDFFNTRDEHKAVAIAQKRHIDLVLICRRIPPFYAGLETFQMRFNAYLSLNKNGHLHMSSSRDHPTLIERLVNGDIPAWLNPVVIPLDPDYLLFEVKLR